MNPDLDEYNTALCTQGTADYINTFILDSPVLLAVKLAEGTMEHVLFALPKRGVVQNGYRLNELVVAIDRHGMYQFNSTNWKAPSYVAEKLNLPLADAVPLAELLNMMLGTEE